MEQQISHLTLNQIEFILEQILNIDVSDKILTLSKEEQNTLQNSSPILNFVNPKSRQIILVLENISKGQFYNERIKKL